MTHLGNTISRLMLANPKLTGKVIADKAGIDPSFLSRLQKGKIGISQESLAKLALAISSHQADRAELIAAHMKDQSCGFYPDLIQVSIGGKVSNTKLHPDIEYLQSHLSDPRIRDAVRSLADLHKNNGNKRGNNFDSVKKRQ